MFFNQILCLLLVALFSIDVNAQPSKVKEQIIKHGEIIRMAFSEGDIEKIEVLHHPEVTKALGYKNLQIGREAVMKGLEETLNNY